MTTDAGDIVDDVMDVRKPLSGGSGDRGACHVLSDKAEISIFRVAQATGYTSANDWNCAIRRSEMIIRHRSRR